ncbi:MAG: response regulator transcription factor [Chloroflexi bacterium]|jgi:DNA-binding NarL/FixJ family response regulator|nr:response regulator transcription factor [Chloroflexota bacterium]
MYSNISIPISDADMTVRGAAKNNSQIKFWPEVENIDSDDSFETKQIRVYVAEEQELLRHAYGAILMLDQTIEVLGISSESRSESIVNTLSELQPDTVLLGVKTVDSDIIERLITIREELPNIGIVLLATHYETPMIERLRDLTRMGSSGCAFLLKHAMSKASQLTQAISAVTQGQVILDSTVMEYLIAGQAGDTLLLKQLTGRELEVLSWIAKGYKNTTIAEVLCVEPNTVERHINSIYNKLSTAISSKNPRVGSTIVYLRAVGQLPTSNAMAA